MFRISPPLLLPTISHPHGGPVPYVWRFFACRRFDSAHLGPVGYAAFSLRHSIDSSKYSPSSIQSTFLYIHLAPPQISQKSIMQALLHWLTGAPQPPKHMAEPNFLLLQRPNLIDPPIRPLPSPRPRRLTGVNIKHDQHQSLLIARLPAEVRVLIWEDVVGGEDDSDVLHLELADGILRHNRCYQRERQSLPCYQHDCWTAAWRKSFRVGGMRGENEPKNHRCAVLPLLFTCKLMCLLAHV